MLCLMLRSKKVLHMHIHCNCCYTIPILIFYLSLKSMPMPPCSMYILLQYYMYILYIVTYIIADELLGLVGAKCYVL
jgi:hypothetical protein